LTNHPIENTHMPHLEWDPFIWTADLKKLKKDSNY
jgi:hypothetical protein